MKKSAKPKYRIRNWKEYNAGLKQRGSLTIWISAEALEHWLNEEPRGTRGASDTYSDLAIETMATVQAIYSLPGRQTEGLLASVFQVMKIELPVPEHSTLSRRRGRLTIELPVQKRRKARHLVVDSTGVKVYGEGEWKVRQHGWSQRRTWRKLHLCLDQATLEIVSVGASTNDVSDHQMLPALLAAVPGRIKQVSGDGSYDKRTCYQAILHHRARAAIPPRKGAKIWQHGNTKTEPHPRDANLRRIRQVGKKQWKRESRYHRRSLAETEVFRYKTIFGDKLQTRKLENQFTEMFTKCALLNRLIHLAKPDSFRLDG